MKQRNIILHRGRLAQWMSFAGGLGLLIALVGLIWQGGLSTAILLALAAGILGIFSWAALAPDDFRNFLTGRQARRGTEAVFSTLFVIGIIALVYIIVQRQVISIDMTAGERFTLSPETEEVLNAAKRSTRDIQITGFYTAENLILREQDDQYLRLYETQSGGKIRRVLIDPREQPGIASPYTALLNQGYNVFIAYLAEDGTADLSTTMLVERSANQERDITEALSRLLISGSIKVYFETGTGTLDPLDSTQQGLSIIANVLQRNGLVTAPFNLEETAAAGGAVPDDASVLIVARPQRPWTTEEVNVIDSYLDGGGSMLILSDIFYRDTIFMGKDSPFNSYLWENFGLRALDAVIVDPAASSQTQLDVISAAVFSQIEIGANLNRENEPDSAVLFHQARPIEVNNDPPVSNGRVIMSSPEAWGETNFDALVGQNTFVYDEGVDFQGPLTEVAWAFDTESGAKILLIGDADFITNGHISSPQGNAILFTDGLGWLTGFNEQVRFQPQSYVTGLPILFVDSQVLDLIAFVTIIIMPLIMLIVAGMIWLRRRQG